MRASAAGTVCQRWQLTYATLLGHPLSRPVVVYVRAPFVCTAVHVPWLTPH